MRYLDKMHILRVDDDVVEGVKVGYEVTIINYKIEPFDVCLLYRARPTSAFVGFFTAGNTWSCPLALAEVIEGNAKRLPDEYDSRRDERRTHVELKSVHMFDKPWSPKDVGRAKLGWRPPKAARRATKRDMIILSRLARLHGYGQG